MRYKKRKKHALLLAGMMLALMACDVGTVSNGTGVGNENTAGEAAGSAAQHADGSGYAKSGSGRDTGKKPDSGVSNADTGDSEAERGSNTTYLPLLVRVHNERYEVENGEHVHEIFEEYPVLAIGTYEWGNHTTPPENRRYDALEARLNALNEAFADGNGVRWLTGFLRQQGVEDTDHLGNQGMVNEYNGNISMFDLETVCVTRSDEAAVSLLVVEQTDATLSELPYVLKTYVLDPETGKDIRPESIVTEMDTFLEILAEKVQDAFPDSRFAKELHDPARAAELTEQLWTLDYDGITVYAQSDLLDGNTNIPCVTVPFADNPEMFADRITHHPADYMTRMLPGRTYMLPEATGDVRVEYEPSAGTDAVPQFPVTLYTGNNMIRETYAKNYPPHYLVHTGGQQFILLDPPIFDESFRLGVLDLADTDRGDFVYESLGFGTCDVQNPARMALYDGSFTEISSGIQGMSCLAFSNYAMTGSGKFTRIEDFWYLEGPELTVRQQVETLGYRRHDEGTLVSKTVTRDMKLRPYRTDRKTFIEFESGGDVFRFDIDAYDADMKLNGIYTIANLFGE